MFGRLEITAVHLLHCCLLCLCHCHCCCHCGHHRLATIHDFTYTLTYLVLGTRRSILLLVPLHLALRPWRRPSRLPCHSLVEVPHHWEQGQPGRALVGAARLHWWWWRWWWRRRRGWWWWWREGREKEREWWCRYQLREREIKKDNSGMRGGARVI